MKFIQATCLVFVFCQSPSFAADRGSSMSVALSGHSDDLAGEISGNYAVSNRWDLNLGVGTTYLPKADLIDVKFGATAVKEDYFGTETSVGIFVGQTQINTRDDLVLDKADRQFPFVEARMGVGPIGVGYRFNLMKEDEGLLIGSTHIRKSTVYPYMSTQFNF